MLIRPSVIQNNYFFFWTLLYIFNVPTVQSKNCKWNFKNYYGTRQTIHAYINLKALVMKLKGDVIKTFVAL